jgi:hypothetical protein
MIGRREILSRGKREHLLLGFCLIKDLGYADPNSWTGRPRDDAEARADWEEHRAELMTFWTQDPTAWRATNHQGFFSPAPGGPGTRPAAWWWFDAPPALRLGDGPIEPPTPENERVLLARHGLLTPGEPVS